MHSFTCLPQDVQLKILSAAEPLQRFYATLLSREIWFHTDPEVQMLQRLSKLLRDGAVRKQRRVTLYIVAGDDVSGYQPWDKYIAIKGIERQWRVSSCAGRNETDLRTDSDRKLMLEVARVLPALKASDFRVLRFGRTGWLSHVFAGPGLPLVPSQTEGALCASAPRDRAMERLRLLLEHMTPYDDVVVLLENDPKRCVVIKFDRTPGYTALDPKRPLRMMRGTYWYQVEAFSSYATLEDVLEELERDTSFQPLVIQHHRYFRSEMQGYTFPSFDFVPARSAAALS